MQQLGYTRPTDYGRWARWGLVPVDESGRPALRWRNGDVRHVGPRVSGKEAPLWLRRAAAHVRRIGSAELVELAELAAWYQAHRIGEWPGMRE